MGPVVEDAVSERWSGLEILLSCTEFSVVRERGCHNPRSLWERLPGADSMLPYSDWIWAPVGNLELVAASWGLVTTILSVRDGGVAVGGQQHGDEGLVRHDPGRFRWPDPTPDWVGSGQPSHASSRGPRLL
jgi:hypothetical protein